MTLDEAAQVQRGYFRGDHVKYSGRVQASFQQYGTISQAKYYRYQRDPDPKPKRPREEDLEPATVEKKQKTQHEPTDRQNKLPGQSFREHVFDRLWGS